MVAIASSLLVLCAGEAILRALSDPRYYVWEPGIATVSHVRAGRMRGIEGAATFAINASGLRGAPFAPDQAVRILALGGSTTECFYLDAQEAWPHIVGERLAAAWGAPVWVGSAGKSGHRSTHHVPQASKLLAQYPRIDVLLVLVGINDFHQFLAQDQPERWRAAYEELAPQRQAWVRRSAFAYVPASDRVGSWLRRTELWALVERGRIGLRPVLARSRAVLDDGGNFYVERRRRRAAARVIRTELPSLRTVLREYRRNLAAIIDVARKRGVRPVLMTQPVMWRPDLPEELRGLLAFGGVGDYFTEQVDEYFSVEALARGMARFNDALRDVCARRSADCVDLASALPRDDTVFFDDCHFNESGARRVAQLVAEHLLERMEYPSAKPPPADRRSAP